MHPYKIDQVQKLGMPLGVKERAIGRDAGFCLGQFLSDDLQTFDQKWVVEWFRKEPETNFPNKSFSRQFVDQFCEDLHAHSAVTHPAIGLVRRTMDAGRVANPRRAEV